MSKIIMQRRYSLKKNKQFAYVYRRGRHHACAELSLIVARGDRVMIGLSASKKVGNAVRRNKLKRRLREIVRPLLPYIKPACYVVVLRERSATASFVVLKQGLIGLFTRHNAFMGLPQALRDR